MEFIITRVSTNGKELPTETSYQVTVINPNSAFDWQLGRKEYRININSLEELLALSDKEGDIIIGMDPTWENDELKVHRPLITIYDGYME